MSRTDGTCLSMWNRLFGDTLRRRISYATGALILLGICLALRYGRPTAPADAQLRDAPSAALQTPPAERVDPDVMALVNREKIGRQELAEECVRHFGHTVLENVVNKYLIFEHCKAVKIEVEPSEIDEEIAKLAAKFNMPVDRWLQLLQEERGIDPRQYRQDIIWPTIALRRLAAKQLVVDKKELQERFESEYGAAVQCRVIGITGDLAKARKIHALVVAKPEEFARTAKTTSDDPSIASAYGLIPPIRRHVGDPNVEKIAFALREGEISSVVTVADQHIILKCERHIPPQPVKLEDVQEHLVDAIRDRKLRAEAAALFKQLKDSARVTLVYGNPENEKQAPGVAALINGRQITMRQLAEECMIRHAKDSLEGLINRRILEQALREENLTITRADLDQEIEEVAGRMVAQKEGKPDVAAWIKTVTSEPGVTVEIYERDSVWPSAALKKIVMKEIAARETKTGEKFITEEDKRKAWIANYGARVRCLGIVLDDLRQARKVWEMARDNPTAKFFGELAEQYSVDLATRSGKGLMPPIQRYGGQPLIEKEAFALTEADRVSGIVQTGGKFVILFFVSRTQPEKIKYEDPIVQDVLMRDLRERKLNVAMAQRFDALQQSAHIVNYLDPSASHAPKRRAGAASAGQDSGARRRRPRDANRRNQGVNSRATAPLSEVSRSP